MAVSIEIKGNNETYEYECAKSLKEVFETGLPQGATGKILIISNATLYGGAVKDFDIVCIGDLINCKFNNVNFQMRQKNNIIPAGSNSLMVNNFCFIFEVKRHPAELLHKNGLILEAEYQDKRHDVTQQSEDQKIALKKFLQNQNANSYTPYITNYIWLRGVSNVNSTNLVKGAGNPNYLSSQFSILELFELTCKAQEVYGGPIEYQLSSWSRSKCNYNDVEKVFNLFGKNYNCMGELTRKKIEMVTKKLLDKQKYAEEIGSKLTIISGRAGTGKTIKILRIACDLAKNKGKRCLLLTYNNALVSDMKRMLALAQFTDDVELSTVEIYTIHKYIKKLILAFGLESKSKLDIDFIVNYVTYLSDLEEYMRQGVISKDDIKSLAKIRCELVYFDYIFIDESQDWNEKEKNVLYMIFGYPNLIIADGEDQLIRSRNKCNWIGNLSSSEYSKTHEKRCIRQKANLVNFVNDYAKVFNVKWEMEPAEEIPGGKVIILENKLNFQIYKKSYTDCLNEGNVAYDILYIVPPNLVSKEKAINRYGGEQVIRSFKYKEEFLKNQIKIWDGTSKDLRIEYSIDPEEHRLVQYESCRGLEGWVVICMDLDEFVQSKLEEFSDTKELNEQINFLYTKDEQRNKFAYLWSIIPLTRAIDTLIITIKEPNSEYSKKLKSIYENNKDFIKWI